MAGLNKVMLIGNVGGDPEIRTLPSGSKVANFSLATSESYTDRSGQKQTQTEWHRIEMWDGLAGIAEQYVRKGDSLFVEGKIRNEKWTDQNGVEKSGVRIRGLSMQMLGSRNDDNNSSTSNSNTATPSNNYSSSQMQSTPATPAQSAPREDDLPF
jgi:single-strand DNA-binding protein